jgi:putative PIN family toxin of toxin-antitoxin system
MRIILDTNLWISYLISKHLSKIDELILDNRLTVLFSEESLEEFIEVTNRPKFEKYFSKEDVINLLLLFDFYGELVEIKSNIEICRDSKDNFLLNLAVDGKADYLITGDKDLLEIGKIDKTSILTFKEFDDKTK